MTLKPFMNYFGSKYRIARHYPYPQHDVIVEPFAGSAGYALRHYGHTVILVEKSQEVAAVWRYLLRSSPDDILALPLIGPDDSVDDFDIPEEAKWLIGMNMNAGSDRPRKVMNAFAKRWRPPWPTESHEGFENFWGTKRRARIARQVRDISHWTLIEGDYTDAPDVLATWFIDPPYEKAGKAYRHNAIDRTALGAWSRARQGQVIVCEAQGARWLPFSTLGTFKSTPGSRRRGATAEVIWTNTQSKCRAYGQLTLFEGQ